MISGKEEVILCSINDLEQFLSERRSSFDGQITLEVVREPVNPNSEVEDPKREEVNKDAKKRSKKRKLGSIDDIEQLPSDFDGEMSLQVIEMEKDND